MSPDRKSVTESGQVRLPVEAHHDIFPSGPEFLAWLGVGTVGIVLLFFALTAGQLFDRGIKAGDVAERDILAPHAASVIDPIATKQAVENARHLVVPVLQRDRSRDSETLAQVDATMRIVRRLHSKGIDPIPELAETFSVTPAEHRYLIGASDELFDKIIAAGTAGNASDIDKLEGLDRSIAEKFSLVRTEIDAQSRGARGRARRASLHRARQLSQALETVDKTLRDQRQSYRELELADDPNMKFRLLIALSVPPESLSDYYKTTMAATERILSRFERFPVSDKGIWADTVYEFLPDSWGVTLRRTTARVVSQYLEPNLAVDPLATKRKADLAVREIKPVTIDYEEGQMLVRKGQRISEEIAQTLQALNVSRVNSLPLMVVLGFSLVSAVVCSALFLLHFEPRHFFSANSIGLIYTVLIVACAAASVIGQTYPQFVPIAGAALTLTIFFGRRVALVLIFPLLVLIAVDRLVGGSHAIALLCASLAAVLGYSRDRKSLMFTGLVIGVAQAGGFFLAYAMAKLLPFLSLGSTPWLVLAPHVSLPSFNNLGQAVGMEFAGGLSSSIIAIGSLPFLENIFGLVTPFRLAELAEADQPLLRQLEEKAPGTYQHSLAVANLAEAGAKAIMVDVKLVRAGALYHDVGKMVRPKFFIENQLGAVNPHDSMSPEDSRDRVLAHVTDGLELARKYSLPKAVSDFIPMHQGTTLMAYFYHKACERDGRDNVDALFYRYPGPKPSSKETAIVMLADVSEAVTHSMKDPSEEEVETALTKVFEARWEDGQFSESGLTYDELQRVKLAFVRVWRTLHHERLKYPSTTTGKMPVAPEEEKVAPDKEEKEKSEQTKAEVKAGVTASDTAEQDAEGVKRGESCS
ncbi:MAG: HD family phosphohydrolase [Candidatus Obscuribacterales bacterium]